ncbi:MupG family TIM beta-alpha barrel fold protein [Xylocopilactobacillus apicola]|uniref:PTS-associated protein n=1 Tax=Xylocopilactobacillus apicola TaxID=2932184 RepID=A0AAU9DUT1_9LACO|nr:MupG family TIM beta-alpha barrel fold protein [Xylocopilactobacillus apicola]BDR59258.1 PTS-associated protein [Xylocopilactobacillus apicola]
MFGFSVFLHDDLTDETVDHLKKMAATGFRGVFTSINLPEDDPAYLLERLKYLGEICQNLKLRLTVDISSTALKRLKIDTRDLFNCQLRLDDGIDFITIAELSQEISLALNASTLNEEEYQILKSSGANFANLEAWHNYYPRKNTGLERAWFNGRNRWLADHGFKVTAFVPGDGTLRGPVFATLPTLEEDRGKRPLAPAIKMLQSGVDLVYVGDGFLSLESTEQFAKFLKKDVVMLHAKFSSLTPAYFRQVLHQRADLARDVIRIVEGRKFKTAPIMPASVCARPRGSITLDNELAQRYAGELEIVKKDLPGDQTVNVIGQIVSEDLGLLDVCNSGQGIEIRGID